MQLEVGKIYEGKVTGITKFGAFIDLSEGKTGMVHISEVAPTFVKEISDYLTQGQTVKVRVLNIAEDGKISLSIKKAMDPPANNGAQRPSRPPQQNRGGAPSSSRNGGSFSRPAARKPVLPPIEEAAYGMVSEQSGDKSFEDMLSKFMQRSDEKISDLKKATDGKRGSYQRRR